MAFHPTNALTMYVGTQLGNVFRSANGGLSWEFMGQPDVTIGQLAVNPFGAHELWAVGSIWDGRLWKYDSGIWVDALPGTEMNELGVAIAFDQNISGTIWIGAASGGYTSTDGGQTWIPLGTLTGDRIGALAIHPLNSQKVYAGYGGNGIYQTADGGTTWRQINDGLAALVPHRLAPVPGEPNTLYASTDMGLMKTADWGSAWVQLPTMPEHQEIVVDPFTHTRIYAGGYHKLYIGENGGTVWHKVPVTEPLQYATCCQAFVGPLLADPIQPGHLVMGVAFGFGSLYGGIYTSTDYGETWSWVNMGREISRVVTLAYDPANPLVLYAGMNSGSGEGIAIPVVKSSDGGNTWQVSSTGLEGECVVKSIVVEPISPHRVFASSSCGNSLWVSTNGGATWTGANSPVPPSGVLQYLVFAPSEPPVLYAGTTHGLYRTWDGAQSWEQMPGVLGTANVHALAIVTATGRTIVYAATSGGMVSGGATQAQSLASGETLVSAGVYRYTIRQLYVYLPLIFKRQ